MLKIGMKRRRTKAQVDADKEEADLREESMRVTEQQSQLLKDRVAELEAVGLNNHNAADILNNLLA